MSTPASVTLHLNILDPQELWDSAAKAMKAAPGGKVDTEIMGTRDNPTIGGCIAMIFDPGESPPGVEIIETTTEVE